jgi:hypothetical protein
VPEVRRVIQAMSGPEEQREFRLGWSLFRRAHQAVAKRCHKATHRAKHATEHHLIEHDASSSSSSSSRGGGLDSTEASEASAPRRPVEAKEAGLLLADTEWERVRALLPRQKPGQGRPRRNDRQVLGGILWVMDTCSSWRDIPEEEFGPNSTVHGRYRKWCKEGLWPRIVKALGR